MADKPETLFWHRIKPQLEALPNTYMERVQQTSIRGTPDVLMCVNGWFIALELKQGPKAPTSKLQEYKLEKIREANGLGLICYPENWDEIYQMLLSVAEVGCIFNESH